MSEPPAGLLSKAASTYEHLKELASEGRLRPGRRLSPPDVASGLRISVTPVRDALARLAAEGFVAGGGGRGCFTKAFGSEEHLALERRLGFALVAAVHPAWGHAGPTADAALEALAVGLALGSGAPAAEAVGRLHLELALASGDPILPELVRNAVERTQRVRSLDLESAERREGEAQDLAAVVRRLRSGETPRAFGRLKARLSALEARLPGLVAAANAAAAAERFP